MSLFRRKESLNERLLREAGLDPATIDADLPVPEHAAPFDPYRDFRARLDPESRAVLFRPREWDVVTTVEAPYVAGDEVAFTTLPDGTLIVDEEQGEASLGILADAIEQRLQPPYRAKGVRHSDTVWGVAANRIEVVRLEVEGDEIELTMHRGERSLTIDGVRTLRPLRPLDQFGEQHGRDYVVRCERLDEDFFEVRTGPL